MALVMVQGHLFETLLSPDARADAVYRLQVVFHGSTAPGFLFASGFVAGLPRAPLSLRASVRRARRLLFVLGVAYALHLPYFSFWKTAYEATPAERLALFASNALQLIAVTQLLVLGLQWLAGRRWVAVAGLLALAVVAAGPWVWASQVSRHLPSVLGAYVDATTGSFFPAFPFAAFVLSGTAAGAALGRQEAATRRQRALLGGTGLLAVGLAISWLLWDRMDFWRISPGYVLLRLGGLLLVLVAVERAALAGLPGVRPLALLGHETFHVYVLHLYLLYGGVLGAAAFAPWAGRLSFSGAFLALGILVALLYPTSWAWHRLKMRAPHEASLVLVFLTTAFLWEFFTRPW